MHHETLLYMLKELPASDKKPSAELAAAPTEPESKAVRSRVGIPAGPARLGTDSGDFRWDNERPEHEVDTEAFEIDSLPVTNRDFREFVEAGGYADPRVWTDDGWRLAEANAPRHAPRLEPDAGEARVATLFGEVPFDDAAAWPASVTHCEAQAFARFSGARLPSESEFHSGGFRHARSA
jgi:formylglycine-generating enzyme required for sulfatase activity